MVDDYSEYVSPLTGDEEKFLLQAIARLTKAKIEANERFAVSDTMIFRRYGKLQGLNPEDYQGIL
jgi:hypothetical protein